MDKRALLAGVKARTFLEAARVEAGEHACGSVARKPGRAPGLLGFCIGHMLWPA